MCLNIGMSYLFKNRGMLLETIINQTNEFYLRNNICMIHKKNLDIKFKSVTYENENLNLDKAIIKGKSSVDYYGVCKGKFLAFEAKSTEDNTLPLSNIREHQITYLNMVEKHQGIAFWIIYFKIQNVFLLVLHKDLINALKNKKSLHYDEALKIGKKLTLSFPGILNFIENLTF
ncbi:Recombination protein U [Metamycoplasma auris 15026]|uniref:Holliday junction resolvase RecU n=1 Tax=Metamycoplasma auris 15026 TaxID=1188233 RepID=N9TRM5_9BACT|nr:Holliday junction resolvase RecU [Metamycoplasma auris]ENY68705.1 Recombination protein U [Metamycoplasma auris 15026]